MTLTHDLSIAIVVSTVLAGCLDPDAPGNLVPKTVDEDPSLPHIEVADTRLHAEAFGDPQHPMVMVLHGGPGGDYRSLLPLKALAEDGYYVVFWDQRGAGLSQRHDPDRDLFAGYLEDLRLVIEYYTTSPEQPIVFIGHSWGAMYATWFINEHGDYGQRVKGAILSEPGAFTVEQLEDFGDRRLAALKFFGETVNDVTWVGQFVSPVEHARLDYLAALQASADFPEVHLDPDNPAPGWRQGAVAQQVLFDLAFDLRVDWTTDLARFSGLVLFLRGELNELADLAHQEQLASAYPNARIETIPNVGHEMIWERPEEYLDHTRAYLAHIGFEGGSP